MPRAKKLRDLVDHGRYFFADPESYEEAAVKKHLSAPGLAAQIAAWGAALAAVEPFTPAAIESALRASAEGRVAERPTPYASRPRDARIGGATLHPATLLWVP